MSIPLRWKCQVTKFRSFIFLECEWIRFPSLTWSRILTDWKSFGVSTWGNWICDKNWSGLILNMKNSETFNFSCFSVFLGFYYVHLPTFIISVAWLTRGGCLQFNKIKFTQSLLPLTDIKVRHVLCRGTSVKLPQWSILLIKCI